MNGVELQVWREARGLTQRELAAHLGVSERMLRYYEAGTYLVPRTVELAVRSLRRLRGRRKLPRPAGSSPG